MKNIKAIISYDGSKFNGFQIQNDVRSVQEELMKALEKIHKHSVDITGAGRTDKGVHALNQVFNFNSELSLTSSEWKKAMNANLPDDIIVKSIEFVDTNFHSRRSAKMKIYSYILNEGEFNPLRKDYEYQLCQKLNLKEIKKAARLFIGKHSFQNFCSNSIEEVLNFDKTIYSFKIIRKNNIVTFTVKGTGFLRYQVRMMVGTLIEIGLGRKSSQYILDRLDKKEGLTTSFNAPSCGLYLVDVKY